MKHTVIKFSMLVAFLLINNTDAKKNNSFYKKAYKPKATLQGFGKISKSTGRTKSNITSGHIKKTKNGIKLVNSYARS